MERTKYVPRSFRLSWSAIWPNLVWTCTLVVRGVRVWAIKLNLTKCKTLYRSECFGDIVHHQVSEVSDIPPFIFLGDHNRWQRSHCIFFQVASIFARAQMSLQKLLICHWSAISVRSPSPRQYKNYTFIGPTFERLSPTIQLFLHIWTFSPKQGRPYGISLLPWVIKSTIYHKYRWPSITKDATTQQKKSKYQNHNQIFADLTVMRARCLNRSLKSLACLCSPT